MRWLLLLVVLSSCFSRTMMMTRDNYDSVRVGMTVTELEVQVGKPDFIRSKGSNRQEYEYIERIGMSTYYSVENQYYIEIMDGVVVGKKMLSRRSPAYEFMYQSEPNFSPDFSSP